LIFILPTNKCIKTLHQVLANLQFLTWAFELNKKNELLKNSRQLSGTDEDDMKRIMNEEKNE
jgi:hypothetical protein